MSLAAALPDASGPTESPDAGRYERPTNDPQPPVGTLPTGPHAEAEAAALQAARSGAELVAYATQDAPAGVSDNPWPTRPLVMFGSVLTADQVGVTPDPLPAPASYSNTSAGRVLAAIDTEIDDNLRAATARMRRERDTALADAVREESLRQQAQAWLAAVTAERDALAVKLAETERALNVLGAAVKHAIRHDEGGDGD